MTTLEILTREELETLRVPTIKHSQVQCEYRRECTRYGYYEPCYTHLKIICPFNKTYHSQKTTVRREDL
jgi:hypothetical protein